MRRIFLALLALAVVLAGCATPAPSPDTNAPDGGDAPGPVGSEGGSGSGTPPAPPEWSFTDTEGVTHSQESTAGKPVLIFWMASWCATCKSKAPMLRDTQQEYAPKGVQFFSVTYDPTDDDDDLDAWKKRYEQPWPHGVDPGFKNGRTFGITSQSSLVILDGSGTLVAKYGYPGADRATLRAALDKALAAA